MLGPFLAWRGEWLRTLALRLAVVMSWWSHPHHMEQPKS
jgi:hypothetical protein